MGEALASSLEWLTSGFRLTVAMVLLVQHSLYVCWHEQKWLTVVALSLLVLMQYGWTPIAQAMAHERRSPERW